MTTYKIAEVAERTGFSASALRYYEDHGLLRPTRGSNGYRVYDDEAVELLGFIARAKQLGLRLDEIADLVATRDPERCAPVQGRLRALVADKIDDAQRRTAELVAFTAQLQAVAASLGTHTPDGPCDDRCGCTSEVAAPTRAATSAAVTLLPVASSSPDDPPLACTLDPGAVPDRVEDWRGALEHVVGREPIERGVRLRFDAGGGAGVDVGRLAELAAAEQSCCSFFAFAIGITRAGVTLDVTAPADARPLIDAVFGVAS